MSNPTDTYLEQARLAQAYAAQQNAYPSALGHSHSLGYPLQAGQGQYVVPSSVVTGTTNYPVWITSPNTTAGGFASIQNMPMHTHAQPSYFVTVKVNGAFYSLHWQPGQILLIEDGESPRFVSPEEADKPKQLSPPMFTLEELTENV